jgi:molybdopterin-binding protein
MITGDALDELRRCVTDNAIALVNATEVMVVKD